MSLSDIPLRLSYRTGRDHLVQDFFNPCLEAAVLYRRAAGYFTSAGLTLAARGVAHLVSRQGKMHVQATDFSGLMIRHKCSTMGIMKGNEFIRKVKALGKRRGVPVVLNASRGKGSHVMLYYGSRKTTVRNPKDELKSGTYHAMLDQLGIKDKDLYESETE